MNRRLASALSVVSLALATAPAMGFVTFDQRENLNVLNSPDVTITSNLNAGAPAQWLRGSLGGGADVYGSGVGWFTGHDVIPPDAVFTIDLGAVRNMKTVRLDGLWNIRSATFQTSADGVTWSSALTHSVTNDTGGSGTETKWTLDAAVDAKWLRINGLTYDRAAPAELGLNNLRVYGDTGSVVADKGLDLVSSTGWTAGNATYSQNGASYTSSGGLTDVTDDNHSDLRARQLTYGLTQGDSVQVVFDQTVTDIGRVGVTLGILSEPLGTLVANANNATVDLDFWGSTDGVNFTTLLYSHTVDGLFGSGPNFIDLATPFTGNGVRMEIVSATGNYTVTDFFVFQVPEPASASLLVLGGALLGRRRRS